VSASLNYCDNVASYTFKVN